MVSVRVKVNEVGLRVLHKGKCVRVKGVRVNEG
jgi:hypothetical protein